MLVGLIPRTYSKNQFRNAQEYFERLLKLKTVDHKLFGDVVRKIRLVNTINIKSGRECVMIKYNKGNLLDLDDFFDSDVNSDYYDYYLENEYEGDGNGNECLRYDYPCVNKFVKDRDLWFKTFPDEKTFEPDWEIRFTWVIKEMMKGRTVDDILDEIETFGWDDFSRRKTKYYINQIIKNNYLPCGRKRFEEMGICLGKECPVINKWIIRSKKERGN